MAVLAEAISVVVRADRLLAVYPGGWDAFVGSVPNETLCADDELVRVGFMVPDDVRAYVAELERQGLIYLRGGEAQDLEHILIGRNRGGFPGASISDSRCRLVKEASLHDSTSFDGYPQSAGFGGVGRDDAPRGGEAVRGCGLDGDQVDGSVGRNG